MGGPGGRLQARAVSTKESSTNLRSLRRSRKHPVAGDAFMFSPFEGEFLLGRGVLANVPQDRAPMPGAHLIYLYKNRFKGPLPDLKELAPSNLLVPPIWTNSLAWKAGRFETVRNEPLVPADLLRQHCFYRVPISKGSAGKYLNEVGAELSNKTEPCGDWGLVSYRWIDDLVSDALGIPRVPDNGE